LDFSEQYVKIKCYLSMKLADLPVTAVSHINSVKTH